MSRCAQANGSSPSHSLFLSLFLFALFSCNTSWAEEELRIAAAASLRNPLEEIALSFKKEHPVAVKIAYGASGSLFAQLSHGAPFDLFLSSDEQYPKRLLAENLASDLFEFGLGRLVLFFPKDTFLPIEKEGMNGLLHPSIRKIAVANPAFAPFGQAALAALNHFGLYEKIRPKLVLGEDVAQAVHFVKSGSAEAGIVAYSVAAHKEGRYWLVPQNAHFLLKQVGVLLKKTKQRDLGQSFVQFVTMGEGKKILQHWLGP